MKYNNTYSLISLLEYTGNLINCLKNNIPIKIGVYNCTAKVSMFHTICSGRVENYLNHC